MNKTALFFIVYALLMVGLIFMAVNMPKSTISPITESLISTTEGENSLEKFKQEFNEKKSESTESSKVEFPAYYWIAIFIASIIDFVIVMLWVNHENKKREQGENDNNRTSIMKSKWFWWVVGLGVVKQKNDRLRFDWKVCILYLALLTGLKLYLMESTE
ncbi:hypothetical protein KDJ21_000575 [Metabacillus litoralis]|uniref:hypothetical protein n=1 Tax=Metabacillus TaxID=2675233 RepID=UPI001B922988|nr:hypothetical protein [Metabacillus litoralis]MCM3161923.1 hypothetical protein [Metabacillus litoralis]UHA60323.1 hypothetical protein KDJ21_000575 [Metabacillus litoralis]